MVSGLKPAMDAVFTMWPSPASSSLGRKDRNPWTTPQKLTPSTHSHSLRGISQTWPPPLPLTPALLQTTWTAPKRLTLLRARSST